MMHNGILRVLITFRHRNEITIEAWQPQVHSLYLDQLFERTEVLGRLDPWAALPQAAVVIVQPEQSGMAAPGRSAVSRPVANGQKSLGISPN